MFYTYAHFKPDNSVFYIGKGQGRRAWSSKNRNPYWHHVIEKHGEHKVELLSRWSTEQQALDHEKFLIWCFRDMGMSLANITDGGDGSSHAEETKKKISEAKKASPSRHWLGKPRSEETKKKISDSLRGQPGTRHTEETRKKLSLAHMGKKQGSPSEETRKKLSESVKKSWVFRRRKGS